MPSQILASHTTVEFQWKLTEYSKLGHVHESGHFALGNLRWKLQLYPRGKLPTIENLELFLLPVDNTKLPYVEFSVTLSSHDHQHNFKSPERKHQLTHDHIRVGWSALMPLTELRDHYLQHDTVTIQVKVTCLTREARA